MATRGVAIPPTGNRRPVAVGEEVLPPPVPPRYDGGPAGRGNEKGSRSLFRRLPLRLQPGNTAAKKIPGTFFATNVEHERIRRWNLNCEPDTWTWKDGVIHCTGQPVGVIQTRKPVKNFELVVEWRHLRPAGNSGVFVWATPESLAELKKGKGRLPKGIECQILDHGYAENWKKKHDGKDPDWFSTNGDVFPCGVKMTPFPPLSANGSRSFPSKKTTKGSPAWNHYYIRAINGEVRLWVNGVEVSGGTGCDPAEGFLCLESEGSPIEFRHLRIREVP